MPKAYLNYIVFDRDFNPILSQSGYKRLTTAARETGTDGLHERVAPDDPLVITQPGYVYTYLSNENETSVEVYLNGSNYEYLRILFGSLLGGYRIGLVNCTSMN